MTNILRGKLIFQSIRKQNFKFKILLFQFIIVFISLNFCFSLLIKAECSKNNLKKLIGIENNVMVSINKNYDDNVDINKILNEKLDRIKKTNGIKAVSRYYKDKVLINDENIGGIFLDKEAMNIYNFNIDGSKNIFKKSKYIPIIISEDLKKQYKINDTVEIDYNNDKFKGKIIGYLNKNDNFWSDRIGNDKSLEKIENSIIIPFDKNCYYNKNLEYRMFNRIIVQIDKQSDINALEKIKNEGIINAYISMYDFVKQIKNQNSQTVFLMEIFAIVISILSLIGFIGVVISYISFRNKEYAIRLTMGSTLKELSILICGEIGISIVISFLISAIISISINIILSVKPFYISLVALIPSLLVSIFIFIIFLTTYILFIKRKTINSLMRGN
ncbi:ABC transporter permease [Clostridium taeniosporum]|uniref:ABC transporter permease n=1 Tax=Clostridium taeniosporum TaxID=394958 RepID=A0A1D7XM65_9CLOT|nr:ABC transporter permease [Clostridium taeniosporum]AOR24435.1 ABC transporter permease [Clostridium taeniosporum]